MSSRLSATLAAVVFGATTLFTLGNASSPTVSSHAPVITHPPSAFNPLTASATQLQEYGFPPRPTGGSALAVWLTAMKAVHVSNYSYSVISTSSAVPESGNIGESRTNWAGYNANSANNGGDAFTEVETQFTVPKVPADSSYPSYESSDPMDAFWTGLGGGYTGNSDGAGYLNQAGVETVSQSTASYYFTTESAGSAPIRHGPVISPYDTAYVAVWYTDVVDGNGYVNYYLENDSSGSAQSFITNTKYDAAEDSFECVAEWPQVPQGSKFLPNFGNMSFNYCDAKVNGGSYQDISNFNYYQDGDWCYSGSTPVDRVQYPSAMDNGVWTVYWEYSGNPC